MNSTICKCVIALEAKRRNTAASNAHQTPRFLNFNYKSFNSITLLGVADTKRSVALIDERKNDSSFF
jgi:hypothetical protein